MANLDHLNWQTKPLSTYHYTLVKSPDLDDIDPSNPCDSPAIAYDHDANHDFFLQKLYQWHLELSKEQYANALLAESLKKMLLLDLQKTIQSGQELRSCDLNFIKAATKIDP